MTDEHDEFVDISPNVHFIESIRSDRGSYAALLSEGVDNGFDAGASEIHLELGKGIIGIRDDGMGITRDRALSLVRLGDHRPMVTTMLGRFGIGIKYHAISAGDILDINSVSVDGKLRLKADWRVMVRGGQWHIPKPRWLSSVGAQKGTEIEISALRWPPPQGKDIERAKSEIRQTFYPALAAGRIITVNGERLLPLDEPRLSEVIETDILLESGKGAYVRAGMIVNHSLLNQVQVSLRHRVLMARSIFGCGAYGGTSRMFARVELTGPWMPKRFKDGLADPETDILESRLNEVLMPILERCQSAKMSANVEEMTATLNDLLPPELVPVRPEKKGDQPETGRKKRGRQHGLSTGEEKPRGPARKRKSPTSSLMIEFEEDPAFADEYGYGEFKSGKPARIKLAQKNPDVSYWLERRDKPDAARALYLLAMAIYDQAQPQPPDDLIYTFGKRLWKLRERQKIQEETAASESA